MRDKYGHHHDTRERVDERLQYSYNARLLTSVILEINFKSFLAYPCTEPSI